MNQSEFDGKLIQYIGYKILASLLVFFTLGFGLPWAVVMFKNWEVKHTTIDGRRLTFDGNGAQLFGNYIKWLLLTFITLGIYGFWLGIKMKQWTVKHTHFAD